MEVLYTREVTHLSAARMDGERVADTVRIRLRILMLVRRRIMDRAAEHDCLDVRTREVDCVVVRVRRAKAADHVLDRIVLPDGDRTDVHGIARCRAGSGLTAVDIVCHRTACDRDGVPKRISAHCITAVDNVDRAVLHFNGIVARRRTVAARKVVCCRCRTVEYDGIVLCSTCTARISAVDLITDRTALDRNGIERNIRRTGRAVDVAAHEIMKRRALREAERIAVH